MRQSGKTASTLRAILAHVEAGRSVVFVVANWREARRWADLLARVDPPESAEGFGRLNYPAAVVRFVPVGGQAHSARGWPGCILFAPGVADACRPHEWAEWQHTARRCNSRHPMPADDR